MNIKNNTKYHKIANKIADMVAEKNVAYGDSFVRCADFLTLLYPDGVKIDDYSNMLTVVRIFDKLMRIATSEDAFGENPFEDIVGYGLLALCSKTKTSKEGLPKTNIGGQAGDYLRKDLSDIFGFSQMVDDESADTKCDLRQEKWTQAEEILLRENNLEPLTTVYFHNETKKGKVTCFKNSDGTFLLICSNKDDDTIERTFCSLEDALMYISHAYKRLDALNRLEKEILTKNGE